MSHDKCLPCKGRESDNGESVTLVLGGVIVFAGVCYLAIVAICMSQRAIGQKEWARIEILIREQERKEGNESNNKINENKTPKLSASGLKLFLASNGIHMTANELKIVCRAFIERQQDKAILGDLVVGIGESYKTQPSLSNYPSSQKNESRMARLALVKKKQRHQHQHQHQNEQTETNSEVKHVDHDDSDDSTESDDQHTHQHTRMEKLEHVMHDTGAAHGAHVVHVTESIKEAKQFSTKLKLLLGFTQIFSMIPESWTNINWPTELKQITTLMKILQFDLFASFDSFSCQFQSGYYARFTFAMLLLPILFFMTFVSFGIVACVVGASETKRKRRTGDKGAISHTFTYEAARNRLNMILFLIVHLGYTFVSKTIIQLLINCVRIQNKWYLANDFHIECYDERWWSYNLWAWLGIIIYVIGIPLAMLCVLLWHRKYLYAEECNEDDMDKHVLINRSYGSIYVAANPHSFYFEILDLVRRLLLTNGLFLKGHVTPIVFGSLVCTVWTLFVVARQPLRESSNNSLAASLSFLTVLLMLGGMALELQGYQEASLGGEQESVAHAENETTFAEASNGTTFSSSVPPGVVGAGDGEEKSFVILMGIFFMVIFVLAFSSLVKLMPCLGRNLNWVWKCCCRKICCFCCCCCREKKATDDLENVQEIEMTETDADGVAVSVGVGNQSVDVGTTHVVNPLSLESSGNVNSDIKRTPPVLPPQQQKNQRSGSRGHNNSGETKQASGPSNTNTKTHTKAKVTAIATAKVKVKVEVKAKPKACIDS